MAESTAKSAAIAGSKDGSRGAVAWLNVGLYRETVRQPFYRELRCLAESIASWWKSGTMAAGKMWLLLSAVACVPLREVAVCRPQGKNEGYFCEREYDDDQAENCRGNSLPELRS